MDADIERTEELVKIVETKVASDWMLRRANVRVNVGTDGRLVIVFAGPPRKLALKRLHTVIQQAREEIDAAAAVPVEQAEPAQPVTLPKPSPLRTRLSISFGDNGKHGDPVKPDNGRAHVPGVIGES